MEFCDLNEQYRLLEKPIQDSINKVLNHGKYILGPEVEDLESKLSAYTRAKHCITVANGTDALQIALMSLGIGRDDEVITPGFTYVATAETIKLLGAVPVFVDIDDNYYNIDPKLIDSAITHKTRAIIAVSLYGQCADFDIINRIALDKGLTVIEDAAQSFGAEYKGKKSCALSKIACTSFFPTKPLGCYGDGGAIFTDDDSLGAATRMIARHGQSKKYSHEVLGVNSRLDTLQAAVLTQKLTLLEDEIYKRNKIAGLYNLGLENITELVTPKIQDGRRSAYAQYTVRTKRRDELAAFLKSRQIPTSIHYPMPIYRQKAFYNSSLTLKQCELVSSSVLSLPMSPYLKTADQDHIINSVKEFFC